MNHGSLFSGIGGFDLAAEWMGWENVFHCEWNDFGQKILKHYWPNAISYGDITKTDFTIHRGTVDILTGGFPCQPYSLAGKRKGTEDDRHLWPSMLRAIKEIQPRWVVGENVPGLVNWSKGLAFEQVQDDLENEGYQVQSVILPASGVNAPHKRDRVWIVAYKSNTGIEILRSERENSVLSNSITPDPRLQRQEINEKQTAGSTWSGWTGFENGNKRDVTNPINQGLQGDELTRTFRQGGTETYDTTSKRIEIPTWDKWPTQSPLCSRDDGFSGKLDGITFPKWRNESIKGFGNAIVPQVVFQIFKSIQEYESLNQ